MKRNFFTLLFLPVFLLTAIHTTQGQQAEKTLVKAFNVTGQQLVLMDVEGVVQVTTWKQEQLRVQMTIHIYNGTEPMLKSFVTSGRYNLESSQTNGRVVISAPGLERQVKLNNGRDLKEFVTYHVFAPEGITVMLRDSETETGYAQGEPASF